VPGGRDPRAQMDVLADVALLRQMRRARVQPHPHPDRAASQRLLRRPRSRGRPRGGREGDEERIPLRVDLDAAVRGERCPHQPPMLRQRLGIAVRAKLVQ